MPSEAFHWLVKVPNVEQGRFLFEVVKTPQRVFEYGLALSNCCANREYAAVYIDKIRSREIALVALLLDGKPQGLGELRFQMRVDVGFDGEFRDLLREKGLFTRLFTNCSPGDWDLLMRDVDAAAMVRVARGSNYDACVPSWIQRSGANNKTLEPELLQKSYQAEPQLRQDVLKAWAVDALGAEQPRFTPWTLGPRVAMALGFALAEDKTAQQLDMSSRSVSDEGVRAIAKALHRNETLTSLVLANNELGDKAMKPLGVALAQNRGLLTLSLAHNRISETGAQALTKGLGLNPSLQLLDLRDNGLPLWVGNLDARIKIR